MIHRRALFLAMIGATIALAPLAAAAAEPSATARQANAIDDSKLFIHGRDLKTLTVYQWERGGKLLHAWPDQKTEVPYDASRVDVKLYNFPTGQFRILFYPTGTRTAWHENESDLIFYSIDAHQVEFLGNQIFDSYPGDASLHPAGTRHHSETISGGIKAEIAFDPQGKSGVDMIMLPGRGMAMQKHIEQVSAGHRITAPADDGASGAFMARSFVFPGYTLVEAHYPAGSGIAAYRAEREQLVYVISGHLAVTSDSVSDELGPGDMVRIVAGKMFSRHALADSVVLEVDGARAPK